MKLPPQISLKNTAHGHGDKGMAFYTYEDAEGVGFVCDSRRESGGSTFVETWRFRWLPDAVFANFKDLMDAVRALPDEAVEAEKAKWPVMREEMTERKPDGHCWMHKDRPATHMGYARTCWIEGNGAFAALCAECVAAAKTDPGVVVRAREQRIADCAARKA